MLKLHMGSREDNNVVGEKSFEEEHPMSSEGVS